MGYTPVQLSDLEEIRDATMRYCHGLDRLDGDWMKSAYWPDATDDHGLFSGNAWDFVDYCMETHDQWRSTMHCIFNQQIVLDPDGVTARSETYYVSYCARERSGALETWYGRYLDEFQKRDEEWRISKRVCVLENSSYEPAPAPIRMASSAPFRPGSFDRRSPMRPIGP